MENDERVSITALAEGRLGWLLTQHADVIVERWTRRVLEDPDVPSANRLTTPVLEDHVPELISGLIERLARHPSAHWGERVGREVGGSGPGVAHARQRFAVHYRPQEAMRELSHFRATLLELCSERNVSLNADEAQLLHAAIDEMMATSAGELGRSASRVHEHVMAVVAHDLRNPLNAIAGQASLLTVGAADGTKAGELLKRNAKHMNRLIGDLLSLSKLEEGTFDIQAKDADLRDIVQEINEQFQELAKHRNIALSCSCASAKPVRAKGDPDRILQAVGNLVANALKFTPPGGQVRVELEAEEEQCVFRVHDTGPGVPSSQASSVFLPFWQASSSQSGQGIGLGLAIASGIVDAHGGTIGLESREGPGATFFIALPYDATPKQSASLPLPAPSAP